MGPQAWTCPLSMVHLIVKSSLKHGLQAWSCPLTVVHLIVKSSLKHGPLNAPIKLKLGQQIGVGLLIVSHLDQLLWWANQKHRAPAISYLLDSFLQVHSVAEPFTSHSFPGQLCWAKTIFLSQTGMCWISFVQFYCAGSHTDHHWRASPSVPSMWTYQNISHIQVQLFTFLQSHP